MQGFSAEMVSTQKSGGQASHSKIYIGSSKVRIEGADQPGVMIMDTTAKIMYVLMPPQKMYMQMDLPKDDDKMSSAHFLTPVNPDNPCAQLKKVDKDIACKKVGSETLNGRKVDKWETSGPEGKGYLWFDPKSHFVVKMETAEFTMEFKNIQEGPQPASLFTIPSDYKKMQMN
jgi:outer membrane lipoprotein-sorting protein